MVKGTTLELFPQVNVEHESLFEILCSVYKDGNLKAIFYENTPYIREHLRTFTLSS